MGVMSSEESKSITRHELEQQAEARGRLAVYREIAKMKPSGDGDYGHCVFCFSLYRSDTREVLHQANCLWLTAQRATEGEAVRCGKRAMAP